MNQLSWYHSTTLKTYDKKDCLSPGLYRTGRLRELHGNPTDQHHPGREDLSKLD
jgi:hypothetical protein